MKNSPQGMKTFYTIWLGQVVSMLGSGLTSFGLAVWIFDQTGQATPFALTVLFGNLPALLLSPVAGVMVDRWNRRLILIVADVASAVITLIIFFLFATGQLTIPLIYLTVALSSVFGAFQEPAYAASVTMLVPKAQLARANGLVQMQQAIQMLVSPLLAGVLFVSIGLRGIMIVDLVTFLFAVGALLLVHIPQPKQREETAVSPKTTIRQDITFGLRYLLERRGLFYLLLFFSVVNFFMNFAMVLLGPLVLSTFSASAFGAVQTVSGVGMMLGSILMSAWGGPKRRIAPLIGFTAVAALGLIIAGIRPSIWLIGAGLFIMLAAVPFGSSLSQVIFQMKVEPEVQGRVFSMRGMVSRSMMPLAFVLAGPLADQIFEPLMQPDGLLGASLVGQLLGAGDGRGIGLLMVLSGGLLIVSALLAYSNPRIRHLEEELPDLAVVEDEGAGGETAVSPPETLTPA